MVHSMSCTTRNALGQHRIKYPDRKKHTRKSVSWHKKRILARLNPKINEGLKIEISQYMTNKQSSLLSIQIISARGEENLFPLRHLPVNECHRIVKALRYLVDEGKIVSNITTKEWDVQIALGVAEIRTFTRKEK